jgi:hypothetical protein
VDVDSSLENLCLRFDGVGKTDAGQIAQEIVHQTSYFVAGGMPACKSSHLCVFNASLVYWADGERTTWKCDRVPWWDQVIVPSLTLNFHRKRLTNPAGAVMQFALRAVNQGIVYRKTTDHVPFDPSIANASLIYKLIKNQAQDQSWFGVGVNSYV